METKFITVNEMGIFVFRGNKHGHYIQLGKCPPACDSFLHIKQEPVLRFTGRQMVKVFLSTTFREVIRWLDLRGYNQDPMESVRCSGMPDSSVRGRGL